jgi:hypothetical protein
MVVIKNIPIIVGSDADIVDLKDEAVSVSAYDTEITTSHEVNTDDTSVTDNIPRVFGDRFVDPDNFFDADVVIL